MKTDPGEHDGLFDPMVLRQRAKNKPARMLRMVAMYEEFLPKILPQLDTSEFETLRHTAHELRGAALVLGSESLTDLATSVENQARARIAVDPVIIQELRELAIDLDLALKEFRRGLESEARE